MDTCLYICIHRNTSIANNQREVMAEKIAVDIPANGT